MIGKIKIVIPVIGTVSSGEEKVLRKKINEFEVPYEEIEQGICNPSLVLKKSLIWK